MENTKRIARAKSLKSLAARLFPRLHTRVRFPSPAQSCFAPAALRGLRALSETRFKKHDGNHQVRYDLFFPCLAYNEGYVEPRPHDASNTLSFPREEAHHDGHQPEGQWDDPFGRGRPGYAAALRAAQRFRAQWRKIRLWQWAMRRLRGAHQRRGRALLPDADRAALS